MKDKTIIILGLGWVGQANALAFIHLGYRVIGLDIHPVKNLYRDEGFGNIILNNYPLNDIDYPVMICVNAKNLDNGVQDLGSVKKAIAWARQITDGSIVLRTTILPKTLKKLSFDYYMPEFLHENYGVKEATEPDLVVIGTKHKKLPEFLEAYKNNPKIVVCKPEVASAIKYLINIWNALRITFVNEFVGLLGDDGLNALNAVFDFENYMKYGKAYGGHCLPKDTEAFVHSYGGTLLRAMIQSNTEHGEKDSYKQREQYFTR